jgi:hypothetical protein
MMELNDIIFGHYNSYLAERENYGNFVGEHIATRRHEVLDCDPYFGGLTFVGDTAYMIVHDERFQRAWCLAPGFEG